MSSDLNSSVPLRQPEMIARVGSPDTLTVCSSHLSPPTVEAQPLASLCLQVRAAASAVGLLASQDSSQGLDINCQEDLRHRTKHRGEQEGKLFSFLFVDICT